MKAQTKTPKKTENGTKKRLSKAGEYFLNGEPFFQIEHVNMRLVLK